MTKQDKIPKIKAIIFDCFGVLLADVLRVEAEKLRATHPKATENFLSILRAGDRGILSLDEVTQQIADILGISSQEVSHMSRRGEVKNEPLLSQLLRLRTHYKLGLLSNINSRKWLDDRFGPGELNTLFDVVIASGEVGMIKPEAGIYELIADRLGVKPTECVMIDDLSTCCEGARAVGMQAIQYLNTHQTMAELELLLHPKKVAHA